MHNESSCWQLTACSLLGAQVLQRCASQGGRHPCTCPAATSDHCWAVVLLHGTAAAAAGGAAGLRWEPAWEQALLACGLLLLQEWSAYIVDHQLRITPLCAIVCDPVSNQRKTVLDCLVVLVLNHRPAHCWSTWNLPARSGRCLESACC
jgi:hypothetical protein